MAEDTPELAFLEFLGEFEDKSGQWLDPLALQQRLGLGQGLEQGQGHAPLEKIQAADTTEDQE